MFFKSGKNFIKSGLILLVIFIASVSIKGNLENGRTFSNHLKKETERNDSSLIDKSSLKHFASTKVHDFDNKYDKQPHTSLYSVNLIIYMIYRVTNKSLH